MRILFFLGLTLGYLQASFISTPLLSVEGSRGAIEAPELRAGMSGFVVRHFDATHSSIIANARVSQVAPSSNRAIIELSRYDGLRQNSLPSGKWSPKANDEVVIAYDYTRALLIAPNEDTYIALTKSIPNVEWIHPDIFATYLSHEGHPTPLVSDFNRFCSASSIGLLFIQSAQTLFTLDCKNFTLLQSATSITDDTQVVLPFYSRVPEIRADWWGEGSSKLEHYHPYYLQQLVLNNSNNKELYALVKEKFGTTTPLLRHFNFKE
jgi:hypothetical protein